MRASSRSITSALSTLSFGNLLLGHKPSLSGKPSRPRQATIFNLGHHFAKDLMCYTVQNQWVQNQRVHINGALR
jgi:hypothetical protein